MCDCGVRQGLFELVQHNIQYCNVAWSDLETLSVKSFLTSSLDRNTSGLSVLCDAGHH